MRVAGAVLEFHAELKSTFTRAAPPATSPNEWGTYGDALHDPTSDHSPKDFPGWGDDICTAGDFPNRPDLGLDAFAVLDAVRQSRDPRVKYGISNDRMFSSYTSSSGVPPYVWRPYNPTDPRRDKHLTHGHLSVVGDARADSRAPWQIGADVNLTDPLDIVLFEVPAKESGLTLPTVERINVHAALTGSYRRSYLAMRYSAQLLAMGVADEARDNATLAAVRALVVATGGDPAPILEAIERSRSETLSGVAHLLDTVEHLETLVRRQAAAMAAAGVALDQADDEPKS